MTEKSNFNPYRLANQYADYLGLKQNKDEGDDAFKSRVAGELRKQGRTIEAHEAYSGRHYDDPDQELTGPMTGILGAVAQAMQGKQYSPNNPENPIGDDIAAGVVVKEGKNPTKQALRNIFNALGVEAGMDFLDSTRDKDK